MTTQTNITPFAFEDNLVRTHLDEHGNIWFVAKDVCRVLGLDNNRKAVENLDDDEKITVTNSDGNPRVGIPHQFTMISESGMYALVFRSRKPQAKAFSKWVRSEVLPTLNKTGSFSVAGAEKPKRKSKISRTMPMLEDLPEDIQHMPIRFRKDCFSFALQVARIEGGMDGQEVHELFINYCRSLYGRKSSSNIAAESVFSFINNACKQ